MAIHPARLPALSLFAALICCTGDSDPRELLSDKIEKTVRLPKGAAPLESYERYYAAHGDEVLAVYINHSTEQREAISRACTRIAGKPFPCPLGNGPIRLVQSGQRAWIDNAQEMPGISGGGCAQVTLEYLPKQNLFTHVECNGPF
jgi:hypothetical protein